MPRNTDIETILFPISLEPVHFGGCGTETGAKVPGYRAAMVRKDCNQMPFVVSTGHHFPPNLLPIYISNHPSRKSPEQSQLNYPRTTRPSIQTERSALPHSLMLEREANS